jgi:hypothetical protein
MNYQKLYDSLVYSRKNMNRKKSKELYLENHHIVPKWMGGDNTKNNLVLLTAKEHFIAHLFLWKIHRNRSSALALHKMAKSNNPLQERKFTSKQFEQARLAFVETQTGDKNWSKINGSPNKGKSSPNKGRKLGPRDYIRGENNPAKRIEVRNKISLAISGRKNDKSNITMLSLGVHVSQRKLSCLYCQKEIDLANFSRWHGDKCKLKMVS